MASNVTARNGGKQTVVGKVDPKYDTYIFQLIELLYPDNSLLKSVLAAPFGGFSAFWLSAEEKMQQVSG